MGPIAVRRLTRRLRGRFAGVLVVAVLAMIVTAHHAEPPMGMSGVGDMAGMVSAPGASDGHHDPGAALGMVACLAAFVAVGASLMAVALGLVRLVWRERVAPGASRPRVHGAAARAGPTGPALLCTWRI